MKDLRKKQRGSFESELRRFHPPSGKSPKQWGRRKETSFLLPGERGLRASAIAILLTNLPLTTLTRNFARLQPSSARARRRLLKRCPTETVQCLSVPLLRQKYNRLSIALLRRSGSA